MEKIVSKVTDITCDVFRNLLPVHATGYVHIQNPIDPSSSSQCLLIQGGVSWPNNTYGSVSQRFSEMVIYNPLLGSFTEPIKWECVGKRFRHSIIYRFPKPKREYTTKRVKKSLIVFGGIVDSKFTNDMFELEFEDAIDGRINNEIKCKDLTSGIGTSLLGTSTDHFVPPKIAFHESLYHYRSDRMITFGGKNDMGRLNDLIIFDFKSNQWLSWGNKKHKDLQKEYWPCERGGHSVNWLNKNDQSSFIVFGGINRKSENLNDVWVFHYLDSDEKSYWERFKCSGTPPLPRASHSSIITSFRNRKLYFVFGGSIGSKDGGWTYHNKNDLFLLDIKTRYWSRVELLSLPHSVYMQRMCLFDNPRNGNPKFCIIGGISSDISTNRIFEFEILMSEKENSSNFLRNDGTENRQLVHWFQPSVESRCFKKILMFCDHYKDVRIITK